MGYLILKRKFVCSDYIGYYITLWWKWNISIRISLIYLDNTNALNYKRYLPNISHYPYFLRNHILLIHVYPLTKRITMWQEKIKYIRHWICQCEIHVVYLNFNEQKSSHYYNLNGLQHFGYFKIDKNQSFSVNPDCRFLFNVNFLWFSV